MAITAYEGPLVIFGQAGTQPYGGYNGERGPSLFDQAAGLLDPRPFYAFQPGQAVGAPTLYGHVGGDYVVIDQVPSAISAVNISASASPAAGAIVLVSTSGAGITAPVSITRADTGATVTGLLAIDVQHTPVTFGTDASVHVWDPTKSVARNVRYTSGGNDTGITFTCNGFDVYGFPMTETTTGANAGVASGAKAFKYISSITHTGSVAGTLSIGTGDVYGLPLRSDQWGYDRITWNATTAVANTGFVAAVTTTATALTGDVRGTYAVQGAASNGTLRLVVIHTPSVAQISTIAGLYGVTQF
jgi:hypothetical protein